MNFINRLLLNLLQEDKYVKCWASWRWRSERRHGLCHREAGHWQLQGPAIKNSAEDRRREKILGVSHFISRSGVQHRTHIHRDLVQVIPIINHDIRTPRLIAIWPHEYLRTFQA